MSSPAAPRFPPARVSGGMTDRLGRHSRYLSSTLLVLLVALVLAACGKRGPPDPPPDVPNTYPRPYPSE
jgi:hypothetical protein